MRYVRARGTEGASFFGALVDESVQVWSGPPWAGGEATTERHEASEVTMMTPVAPSKIVAVGRNYLAHVTEMGFDVPQEPSVFVKPPSTLVAPGGDVVLPPTSVSHHVEHEAELGVVIGRRAFQVPVDAALDVVFGYTCANDVSARDLQRKDATLARGKGWDTFCPVGPWIESDVDVMAGPAIRCRVNGEVRQDSNLSDMIFDVPTIISYISGFMTLFPGDLVLTGSPGGSGVIRGGDRVEIEIEGIGALEHHVRDFSADWAGVGEQ